jgi:hypothetical protein
MTGQPHPRIRGVDRRIERDQNILAAEEVLDDRAA